MWHYFIIYYRYLIIKNVEVARVSIHLQDFRDNL